MQLQPRYLLLLLLLLSGGVVGLVREVRADVLVLKSGERIEGEVVLETDYEIWLRVSNGELSFRREAVERVIRAPWPEEKPEPEKEEEKEEAGAPEEEGGGEAREEPRPEAESGVYEAILDRLLSEPNETSRAAFVASGQAGLDVALDRVPSLTPQEMEIIFSTIPEAPPEDGEGAPPEPDPVPFLLACLERPEVPPPTLRAGLEALGRGHVDERAFSLLFEFARREPADEPEEQGLVIRSLRLLGEAGNVSVASRLVPLLSNSSAYRRLHANAAVRDIIRRVGAPRPLRRRLAQRVGDRTREAADRDLAWSILVECLTAEETGLLRSLAASGNPVDRWWAAEGCGRLQNEATEGLLRELLRDPEASVRVAAIRAIGDGNRRAFVPRLIALLPSRNRRVVRASQSALEALTGEKTSGYAGWLRWWNEVKDRPPWESHAP